MNLTKKQLWNLLLVCREKPLLEKKDVAPRGFLSIYGIVKTKIHLPYRIGADFFCKEDIENGCYLHGKFVLASIRDANPFCPGYNPEETQKRYDVLFEKYQRWVDELWGKQKILFEMDISQMVERNQIDGTCPFAKDPVEIAPTCMRFEKCKQCSHFDGEEWYREKDK